MLQGGYTAALGISSQQKRMDTTANNLANVNTNAYKWTRTEFKDALYAEIKRTEEMADDANLQRGSGVLLGANTQIFSQGTPIETGTDTDLCIVGDGYFRVELPGGGVGYTRDGSFAISVEEGLNFLTTNSGMYVLDENDERIIVQGDKLQIRENGDMFALPPGADNTEEAMVYGRIQVVTFPNQQGLNKVSNNVYVESDTSGAPQAAGQDTQIKQGMIESSNVRMEAELSTMIRSQRSFSLASRALTVADRMEETAIALKA